jgi:cytochrome P450
LDEIYVKKNKYFDKFPLIKNLLYPLMGDSILLDATSDSWGNRRKSLSTAFYKEKLLKMIELVK